MCGSVSPLTCGKLKDNQCPIILPCKNHHHTPLGYREHIEKSICKWLKASGNRQDIVVTVPCDSTDAWIVAAYRDSENVEMIENPWEDVISKGKYYHNVRIPGHKKNTSVYAKFLPTLEREWEYVVHKCSNAKNFDDKIRKIMCCS